ncbi:low temperature requirement protein A [Sciscionella marina]|uniref:low temperature requirement protein A n=1 Tax=Sciscionella marina TaxID=508770 RepID=UPI000367A7EA|nr:low temperature requirement protein A [Sciscionella marina]
MSVTRHASWLELFFDLVVVVAVNQLAHLLHGGAAHGPGALDIVAFFTLYLAIWLVWVTFTLYSNVVAEKVRVSAMFVGMAGIAVMAAAVPHSMDGRAAVFASAYLATTAIGSSAFQRSGTVVLSWTAASQNAGLVPWIVSFWVGNPWGKLGLWLFGLALTLTVSVFASRGDHDELLARLNERARRRAESRLPVIEAAQLDTRHLGERLGLFVIIVFGEAMLQGVRAVAGVEDWRPGAGAGWLLLLAVVSAFLLLITLWWLNIRHGFAEETRFPAALVLPAHFVVIASITTVAAGLGAVAAGPVAHLAPSSAWLMCGGTSAFLLVIDLLVAHARRWPLRVAALLVPLVAAIAAPWLPAAVLVTAMAVAAGAQLLALSTKRITRA